MRLFKPAGILILFFAAQALNAQGLVIVQQDMRDGENRQPTRFRSTRVICRTETHATGDATAVVFDAGTQTIRMINLDKKTYMEIDKAQMDPDEAADVAGASAQMSAAQQKMEEQMKNMPPAQRAMVEQMMKSRGGMPGAALTPAAPAPIQYHQTGSDKVGQWSCTKYDGMRGEEKVVEICTVDPKDAGVTAADFEIAKQLADFMKTLAPQAPTQNLTIGSAEQGFSGIPVRHILYSNGKVTATMEIKEFRHEAIPAATFDLPAGFTKQTMGARP